LLFFAGQVMTVVGREPAAAVMAGLACNAGFMVDGYL